MFHRIMVLQQWHWEKRHLNKKARRSSHKNHVKGPKKRTEEDDERFAQSFEKMILMAQKEEKR